MEEDVAGMFHAVEIPAHDPDFDAAVRDVGAAAFRRDARRRRRLGTTTRRRGGGKGSPPKKKKGGQRTHGGDERAPPRLDRQGAARWNDSTGRTGERRLRARARIYRRTHTAGECNTLARRSPPRTQPPNATSERNLRTQTSALSVVEASRVYARPSRVDMLIYDIDSRRSVSSCLASAALLAHRLVPGARRHPLRLESLCHPLRLSRARAEQVSAGGLRGVRRGGEYRLVRWARRRARAWWAARTTPPPPPPSPPPSPRSRSPPPRTTSPPHTATPVALRDVKRHRASSRRAPDPPPRLAPPRPPRRSATPARTPTPSARRRRRRLIRNPRLRPRRSASFASARLHLLLRETLLGGRRLERARLGINARACADASATYSAAIASASPASPPSSPRRARAKRERVPPPSPDSSRRGGRDGVRPLFRSIGARVGGGDAPATATSSAPVGVIAAANSRSNRARARGDQNPPPRSAAGRLREFRRAFQRALGSAARPWSPVAAGIRESAAATGESPAGTETAAGNVSRARRASPTRNLARNSARRRRAALAATPPDASPWSRRAHRRRGRGRAQRPTSRRRRVASRATPPRIAPRGEVRSASKRAVGRRTEM